MIAATKPLLNPSTEKEAMEIRTDYDYYDVTDERTNRNARSLIQQREMSDEVRAGKADLEYTCLQEIWNALLLYHQMIDIITDFIVAVPIEQHTRGNQNGQKYCEGRGRFCEQGT